VVAISIFGFVGKQKGWIGKPKAQKVVFDEVKLASIVEKVSASGKIQPVEEVKISPEVPGEILELFVAEGDSVVKGQLLAKIRPDNLRSAYERTVATLNTQKANFAQAKSRLAQAQAQFIRTEQAYNRNKGLFEQKVISEQEYEASMAEYQVAKADLNAAEQSVEAAKYTVLSAEASVKEASENLSFTNIYAPMGGIITKLLVEAGERVVGTQQMAGTEMMRIANLNQMEVRVNVNENDIIRIGIGDTVLIDVDAYSYLGVEFKGLVSAIANSANQAAGTASLGDAVTEFEVKIRILKESYEVLRGKQNMEKTFETNLTPFRPGMTASVDIITERKENVLSVPLASVTTRSTKQTVPGAEESPDSPQARKAKDDIKEVVFVVENDTLRMAEVRTGISDFENIEILDGLKQGEKIVRGPFLQVSKTLKQGDRVEPMEEGKKD
jgi:HlyD family secretion protein